VEDKPQYDFSRCLDFMEAKGKEVFGSHFRLYEADYPLLYTLLIYIIGDKANAQKQGLNLRKGILLSGPVGCGKTSLMTLLRFFQPLSHQYVLRSCREVSFEFIRDGYEVIHTYSRASFGEYSQQPRTYCFDDLGTESSLKYYGNSCNVMGEILLSRYDLFVSRGMRTHLTTNLTSSEIEKNYGNRVRSRMREMFNLVSFGKDARDKRS
jgi:hypothetical protein